MVHSSCICYCLRGGFEIKELLSVEKLNFSWGMNHVLKDVTFNLSKNQIVSLLGKNGAGKSTLIKCLNRILSPQSGVIKVNDNDIKDLDLVQLSKLMSYVPQSVRTNFSMDVFDVILLGRRPHIRWRVSPQDRDKVSETIRYLGLEEFSFRRFDEISGGERQRVIIAKAVVQDPDLYLFDEPTSDLDLNSQIQIMKRIRQLVSVGDTSKSALIAIHDINIAARFSDRIILMHDGGIKAYGTPEEVLTEQNIAEVFGVSSELIKATENSPLRILIKDEIIKFDSTDEQEVDDNE